MRISLAAPLIGFMLALSSAANAQIADKRSFLHPLGFWSNNYYVKQRQVYSAWPAPSAIFVGPTEYFVPDPCCGGGVMHERNW